MADDQELKRYELLIEYKSLLIPGNCPLGVYVTPIDNEVYVWYGIIFIHSEYYQGGIFRFQLNIPFNYPAEPPVIQFKTEMFHPLIGRNGLVSLDQFGKWDPKSNLISHVLQYLRNSFTDSFLASLNEFKCLNKEAARMYKTDRLVFIRLSKQCAIISQQDPALHEQVAHVKFTDISQQRSDELKFQLIHKLRIY